MNSLQKYVTNHFFYCSLKTVIIVLLVPIVYLPAMRGEFIWDDYSIVSENPVLQPNGLYKAWLTNQMNNFWPVTWTVIWLEHAMWKLNPLGYHLVNIFLHTASSLLAWRILESLKIPCAWWIALLFAIHPVNVESVAWITQHKNTISMVLFSSAIFSYLRFENSQRYRTYLLSLACFLLAMLSKGAAMSLPFLLLLFAWWQRGSINRRDLLHSIPFFMISIAMGIVELWFHSVRVIGDETVREDGILGKLAGAGWTVWFYISKAILPINLSLIYPRWSIDPTNWRIYLPGILFIAILLLCYRNRETFGRPPFFALLYFVLTLGPVLGFVDIGFFRFSFVADHYQYFSIIAIIALMVSSVSTLAVRSKSTRQIALVLGTVCVMAMSTLTIQQAKDYQNEGVIWQDIVSKDPESLIGRFYLGRVLFYEHQQVDAALHQLDKMLSLGGEFTKTHQFIGTMLEHKGDQEKALYHYQRATEIDPKNFHAYKKMANILIEQDKAEAAIPHLLKAIEIIPYYTNAHALLGQIYQAQKKNSKAIYHYNQAALGKSQYTLNQDVRLSIYRNLNELLISEKKYADAIQSLQRAADQFPRSAEIQFQLATALFLHEKLEEAEQHFLQTLAMAPDIYEAHNSLGEIYLKTNQTEAAIEQFRKAIELNPLYERAVKNLEQTQKKRDETK